MVAPVNVRLPLRVSSALDVYARRMARPRSSVISLAVDEWLRLQSHPGIRFVTPVSGIRRAALVDGPEVWSVAEAWLQFPETERSAQSVADTIGLRPGQVEAALSYWADNRAEIDDLIAQIQQAQDEGFEAWQRRQALDLLP